MAEGHAARAPVPPDGAAGHIAMAGKPLASTLTLALAVLATGCGASVPGDGPDPDQEQLVFLSWEDDLPLSVIEAFEAEFGVEVVYQTYESTDEAVENLRAGGVYDVAVIDGPYIPGLVAADLLAEIDYRNVPNFRHVSANFRDLAFDPANRYSVTYNWGLAGLIVRNDLVGRPVTAWRDLWAPDLAGRVLVWEDKDILIGITLQSLGYSINTDSSSELDEALRELLRLRGQALSSGYSPEVAMQALESGSAVLMYGWSADAMRAQEEGMDVGFVLPEEGSIQWIDNFTIPASSPRKALAESFIDFMLRPEISARVVNEQYYPTANENAYPFIDPEILADPLVFPPLAKIANAEVHAPVGPSVRALHERIWDAYLVADAQGASGH
jgi:spermidine/putrescine transport system substrate-binding protein